MQKYVRIVGLVIVAAVLASCSENNEGPVTAGPEVIELVNAIDDALAAGQYQRAMSYSSQIVTDNPRVIAAWMANGRVNQTIGRLDSAHFAFEQVVSLDPEYSEAWHSLGNIAVSEQRYVDAVRFYRQGGRDESSPHPWHGLGRAYLEIGEMDSSRIALTRSIEIDPSYAGSQAAMAELLEREGNIEDAITYMWQAQTLSPESDIYRSELGRLLDIGDRPAEAIIWLEPLLEKSVVKSQTLFALSSALRKVGRTAEAEHLAEQFQIVSDREAEVFRFEERVRLNPTSVQDRLQLADAYTQVGEFQNAIRQLLVVDGMTEPNADLMRNISSLYLAAGDSLLSRQWLESAAAIDG